MNVRFAGMLIAVAIAFIIVLLPLDLGEIGLVGAPIVGLLGWWMAPVVAAGTWRWAAVSGLGIGALAAPRHASSRPGLGNRSPGRAGTDRPATADRAVVARRGACRDPPRRGGDRGGAPAACRSELKSGRRRGPDRGEAGDEQRVLGIDDDLA